MQNLLKDAWLPCRLRGGATATLPIAAITAPDVIDLDLPREDFHSGAYQLLIAILQTAFAPADEVEWGDYYIQPPSQEALQERLRLIEHAFNVTGTGPLFMQDSDALEQTRLTSVSGLLIDAPGENAIRRNTDHFVKRGVGEVMSPAMATLALWTLQINAPAGGAGHRVGLRGGGPLTVLVMPNSVEESLWRKLWLNVINRDFWPYEDPDFHSAMLFPWLGPTRTSEKKGSEVYLNEVHPLQMYWSMPRRIRLQIEHDPAVCSISGIASEWSVRWYRTQNYGVNYSGNWGHPLTPYRWEPNKPDFEELSLKGQPGGLHYKLWDVLTLSSHQLGQRCSRNVEHYYKIREELGSRAPVLPRLWVSGFDMDNMKARGWHSAVMPLFSMSSRAHDQVLRAVKQLQELANQTLWHCRSKIKAAWFERPSDVRGDMSFVDLAFWQSSEAMFFEAVRQIVTDERHELSPQSAGEWLRRLRVTSLEIFDEFAFTDLGDVRSMNKRVTARRHLMGWLHGGKDVKAFMQLYQIEPLAQQEGAVNG